MKCKKQISGCLMIVLALLAVLSAPDTARPEGDKTDTVTLRVDGMTCASCDLTVRMTLKRLDGVSDAIVTRKPEGRAVVTFDPGKVTAQQMITAIERAGYRASLQ